MSKSLSFASTSAPFSIRRLITSNVFLKYTMKQWGQTPEEISPEVTARVPVLISYDNRYFQDRYQGVPTDGFTAMFARMSLSG